MSAWSRGEHLPELVLSQDDFDEEPENTSQFSHGEFILVGHGERTNLKCGRFSNFKGCLHVKLHDKTLLGGQNYRGKVYVKIVFHSCDKPSCPVCMKYGWAVRGAFKIESRLKEASKRFGQVEHIVATVPSKFYGLDYERLRAKIRQILKRRNVIGGVMIFHGFRFNLRKHWYWSPHLHVLGFIAGGYGRCRSCKKKCFKGCGGWRDRNYRAFEKDGCVVKVMGKRKTVGGTAWYQLNHASTHMTKKRFHVAVWFGVCSYRKLKLTKEKKKSLCVICGNELVKLRYSGDKHGIWGCYGLDRASCKKRDFASDLEEDGIVVWREREPEEVW